jgi:hypothetical protein
MLKICAIRVISFRQQLYWIRSTFVKNMLIEFLSFEKEEIIPSALSINKDYVFSLSQNQSEMQTDC